MYFTWMESRLSLRPESQTSPCPCFSRAGDEATRMRYADWRRLCSAGPPALSCHPKKGCNSSKPTGLSNPETRSSTGISAAIARWAVCAFRFCAFMDKGSRHCMMLKARKANKEACDPRGVRGWDMREIYFTFSRCAHSQSARSQSRGRETRSTHSSGSCFNLSRQSPQCPVRLSMSAEDRGMNSNHREPPAGRCRVHENC